MRSFLAFSALFCASLFVSAPASAQMNMPGIDLMSSVTTETALRQKFGKRVTSQLAAPRPENALGAQNNSSVPETHFTYRYDRAQTQKNLRNFVERTPVEAGRADLEQLIKAQPNIMSELRTAIRGYGLDSHNVADAYTLWWINVWSTSQKTDKEPSASVVRAVKQQVRNAFAATPDFNSATDVQRQEYAEALMLQAMLLSAAFDQSQGDPNKLEQLAQAARQGAKASGLDLSLMTLTANGFVPRTGADASEAVDGGAAHALAKDSSSEQDDDDDSSMGIALAAGAGLGLVLLAGGAILRKG